MREKVIDHLGRLARGHHDLIASLPEADLSRGLVDRSNTIGSQVWCVVGARESYTRALTEDGWVGFNCSLSGSEVDSKDRLLDALASSEEHLDAVLSVLEWTATREGLLLDLLEHEAQHQGQLIRYMYALGRRFPESWVSRWALDQPF